MECSDDGGGCPWFRSGRGGRPMGSMERDNYCKIRMKHCVSMKGINREQEITSSFYGAGGMEVFYLTSIRHSVKLCTSSYIQEKLAPVGLLHASSVLVIIA